LRVTNIDTISALIDRLIVEEIKKYFFEKENREEELNQQVLIIAEIKSKLSETILECVSDGNYEYLSEKRTFKENSIVESIDDLIIHNLNIGDGDRSRLSEVLKESPNFGKILVNEKLTRKSNEGRSRTKNQIDLDFQLLVKSGGNA